MAVIQKTLFAKNLDRYSVLVTDTDPNSRYFKITELPDTFTGGKNAFLIAGSEELLGDTKIQIELKDSSGNIIYHEPAEGIISSSINGETFVTEYFEGVSKVVSVYIYPDTAFGPCTLTILGELSKYEDNNGITTPIPTEWEGKYNVKWQKTINVNPSLANTTKIRFYRRPSPNITEIVSSIYRIENDIKVASNVTQSFANVKLSNLETFAGDVKRIKVYRTSEGDISDYALVQDILVEAKELMTSYGLSGSVVGNTGIFTPEVLKNQWNSGSLTASLDSSRVEAGVRLSGSGLFRYTQSLDLTSANTYELNLDAFYSASTNSNLEIFISSGSISSSIGTLIGTQPTKNLLDTIIPFKINNDYPTASLYFSQSQGQWHLGNISLKLSEDTAFSPDEVSFITPMPTLIGNETFNFKFEFYDVNNNYVPVSVTQSVLFKGGSTGSAVDVDLIISSSFISASNLINAVSSSISGTMTVYSSSASSSVNVLSGSVSGTIGSVSSSVSGTIGRVSGSISGSIYSLSGSVSSSLTLTSGSITLVSSSLLFTSQSLSSSLTTLSASVSSSFSNASSQSAYQVYSASQYLDKFIFTDENGKLNQPPTASSPGLYLGSEYLGYYNGTGTSGWKTYMDNQGDFYLTSSIPGGGLLAWDSSTATLQINGSINIQGGNAATNQSLSSSFTAVSGAINSATSSLSSSVASSQNSLSTSVASTTFTTNTGLIAKPPTVLVGSTAGLYLGNSFLGYYDGAGWKTFMANNGNFYLSGSGGDSLTWAGGVLSIKGAIDITGGNVQSSLSNINATTSSLNSATSSLNTSVTNINSSITNINTATGSLDARIFTNSSGLINKTPSQTASGLYLGSTNLGYYNGSTWKTYMDNAGKFFLSGVGSDSLSWDGSTLTINGAITVTGGNAATTTYASSAASTAQSNAISAASGDATTKANNAQAAAIAAAASDAQTRANAAQTAAQLFATSAAGRAVDSGSAAASAAQTAAISQAKTDASASVNLLANGNWTGGTGTFITATSISSPVIAGNGGYISGLFVVGNGGAITLDGVNKKMYIGTGTFNNPNTSFFVDNTGRMSLKDKLVWDGTTLSITGDITVSAGPVAAAISNLNSTTSSLNSSVTNINSSVTNINSTTSSLNSSVSQINTATGSLTTAVNGKINAGDAAADVNSNSTSISGGKIRTGIIESTGYSYPGTGNFSTTGTQINLDNGLIRSKNFGITSAGDAYFKGAINGGTISIGSKFNVDSQGNVSATNAALTGSIVATSGKIGDWIINAGKLTNSAGSITIDADGRSIIIYGGGVPKVSISGQTELTNPYANNIYSGTHPGIGSINTSLSVVTSAAQVTNDTAAVSSWFGTIALSSGVQTIAYYGMNIDMSGNSMPVGAAAEVNGEGRDGVPGSSIVTAYIDFRNKSSNNIYSVGVQTAEYTGGWQQWDPVPPNIPANVPATYSNSSTGLRNLIITLGETGNYEWRVRIAHSYAAAADIQSDGTLSYISTTAQGAISAAADYINIEVTTNLIELTNRGFQVLNNQDNFVQIKRYDTSGVWSGQPLINVQGGQGIRSYGVDPGAGNDYGVCLDLKGRIDLSDVQGGGFYSMFPKASYITSNGNSAKLWTSVYAQNGTIQTSDRNQKKNIENSELGLQFINDLRPVKYKFIKNTSDRTHYGLIAQDVTSSLDKFNIDKKDFAGFISYNNYVSGSNEMTEETFSKIENEDDKMGWNKVEKYSLRYDEFISPMIKAMQELSAKVQELEARLSGSI